MRTSDGRAEGSDNATRRTMNAAGGAVMVAHTPGPWSLGGREEDQNRGIAWSVSVYADDAERGSKLPAEAWAKNHDTAVANARLIAASPDLLAACEALVERYGPASGYTGEQRAELLAAESAISRARGLA